MQSDNIFDLIRREAAGCLGRPALIEPGGRSITYGELFGWVDRLAGILRTSGVCALGRVGLVLGNSPEYVACSLAVLSLRAAIVPVSPEHTSGEIGEVMRSMGVGHLLYADGGPMAGSGGEAVDGTVMVSDEGIRVWLSPCGYDKAGAGGSDAGDPGAGDPVTGDLVTGGPVTGDLPEGYAEITPAFIRFSSGTTGDSKGVVLSHRDIEERTTAADAGMRITTGDSVLWVLSMSFHFVVTILLFLRRGAGIVICNDPFPDTLLAGIRDHGGNVIYAAPYHYDLLAGEESVPPDALSQIRLAISTTVQLPSEVAHAFEDKFSLALTEAYGIIEVGLPFVSQQSGGGLYARNLGRPLPAYEIRIDAPDDSGTGEILLRGPGMLSAYFNPWRRKADALDDGWFRTGDLGRLTEGGELLIVGRRKNVINFSGMKIFPYEVEEVINSYEGVRESLVYAEGHARFGQLPMARVVADDPASPPDMRGLRRYCYGRLAKYKVPKGFELVDELPRTPSGKLIRR